jgi:hypothetical protein
MLAHGITWPQVLQTAELEKGFGIAGYPTNILIYPDGRTALRMESSLDRTFLGRILH